MIVNLNSVRTRSIVHSFLSELFMSLEDGCVQELGRMGRQVGRHSFPRTLFENSLYFAAVRSFSWLFLKHKAELMVPRWKGFCLVLKLAVVEPVDLRVLLQGHGIQSSSQIFLGFKIITGDFD